MKMEQISETLSMRRKSLGISQAQLAKIAAVSSHTISDIESGKGNPTIESLIKVSDVLGMDVSIDVRRQL